jgi:hypothetical protein
VPRPTDICVPQFTDASSHIHSFQRRATNHSLYTATSVFISDYLWFFYQLHCTAVGSTMPSLHNLFSWKLILSQHIIRKLFLALDTSCAIPSAFPVRQEYHSIDQSRLPTPHPTPCPLSLFLLPSSLIAHRTLYMIHRTSHQKHISTYRYLLCR